jgi:hypothetical protein
MINFSCCFDSLILLLVSVVCQCVPCMLWIPHVNYLLMEFNTREELHDQMFGIIHWIPKALCMPLGTVFFFILRNLLR